MGHHELPLEIDRVVVERSEESQDTVLAGDQKAGVSGLPVHPGAKGDAGHTAAWRNYHPEAGGRAGEREGGRGKTHVRD